METLILIAIVVVSNIVCFIVGAKIGQMIIRQETINLNPVKAVENAITEHKEALIKEAEDEYYKAIYQNIDNYTGDSIGQVEVPRRK